MARRRVAAQRGSIAAEQVAVVALIAAVIAGVWAVAVPDRVEEAGTQAVDCLFAAPSDGCDLDTATREGDGDGGGAGALRDGAGPGPGPGAGGGSPVEVVTAAADRERDVARQLEEQATELRALADRDLADLAVWDELQELEARLGSPVGSDDQRAADLERVEQLRARMAAAPDGSLLAELRDTDAARRAPMRSAEDTERLLAVMDRTARAEHADHLATLLEGWAASDRRFVHLEVDLDDGTARVAEVVHGDLDSAGHVAVVIPGTGSDAHNFDRGTREHALALGETLELVPGGDDVAVVACLCYAPPSNLLQAARSRHADAGGADLARIIGDLPVATDAQLHTLGYSYGSTALGRAVTREGLEVTSTVSLGGPGFGSGVSRVEDMPDGAGRVWGIRHGLDPIDLAGMHGRNPDRDDFGAYRAGVGDGDLERRWWKPYQFDAHAIYYQDAESLRNLALIVSGQHDQVSGYREGRR